MSKEIDWSSIPVEELEVTATSYKSCKVRAVVESTKSKGIGTVIIEHPDGTLDSFSNHTLDQLLKRKPKTFLYTYWANIYRGGCVHFFLTRANADEYIRGDRVACIEVPIEGKEGEGL